MPRQIHRRRLPKVTSVRVVQGPDPNSLTLLRLRPTVHGVFPRSRFDFEVTSRGETVPITAWMEITSIVFDVWPSVEALKQSETLEPTVRASVYDGRHDTSCDGTIRLSYGRRRNWKLLGDLPYRTLARILLPANVA